MRGPRIGICADPKRRLDLILNGRIRVAIAGVAEAAFVRRAAFPVADVVGAAFIADDLVGVAAAVAGADGVIGTAETLRRRAWDRADPATAAVIGEPIAW